MSMQILRICNLFPIMNLFQISFSFWADFIFFIFDVIIKPKKK